MNKKIKITLKAFDHRILDSSVKKIIEVARTTGASVNGPVPLPTKKEIFTILRSVHVNKKSREQFELRTHKRLLSIINSTSQTIDQLTRLELPSGVGIEVAM